MSIARIVTEQRDAIRQQVVDLALKTGGIYKNADGELCANDDKDANDATYGAVTNAMKSGQIEGDRDEVMAIVKDVLELPE